MYCMYIMLLLIGQAICHSGQAFLKPINGGTNPSILVQPVKQDHGSGHYSVSQNEITVPVDEASSQINPQVAHHDSDKHAKHIQEETSKQENTEENFAKFQEKSHTSLQRTDTDRTHHIESVKLPHEKKSKPRLVKTLKRNHISVNGSTSKSNNKFQVAQVLPQINLYKVNNEKDMNTNTKEENSTEINARKIIPTFVSQIYPYIPLKNNEAKAKDKEERVYIIPENETGEKPKVHTETLSEVHMVQQARNVYFKSTTEGNSIQEKAQNIIEDPQNKQPTKTLSVVTNDNIIILQEKINPFLNIGKTKHGDNARVVRDASGDNEESLGFIRDWLTSNQTTVNMNSIETTSEALYKTSPSEEPTSQQKSSTVLPVQSSTNVLPPIPYCHQSCLKALNETHMYSNSSLTLSQGSDLTLICELPLNTKFYLVNLVWLFHPDNSPDGQCSLTTQEFISSCQGFQTIKNTDDRNSTLLREIITLSNILVNHTGRYMCQVQMTCCPNSQEHIMSQERIFHVTIKVWTANYTYELAMAGSVAVSLILIMVAVSFYLHKQRDDDYITIEKQINEIKQLTVLHMPLIDDQDNDSFDSNFDEQD
ncbi:uncharacterized protein [Panulirus ornatus]|uniref:uncharacterized protein n=1 Tax=Panulirus ornatus TaxID=150431 RepID=UPI003A83DD78